MWKRELDMTLDEAEQYLVGEGLMDLLDAAVSETQAGKPIAPDLMDLARLHRMIRQKLAFTVLEFGIGYSTIAICDALEKNERQWSDAKVTAPIRNRFMWQLFSVDTSEHWINETLKRLPAHLEARLHVTHTAAHIALHQGQVCHFFDTLPDVVPDFVYLDGPDPSEVTGQVHGLSFACRERTVMAADLLLMESTFLPGTQVLVDGRTNNARFLARNFRRSWTSDWSSDEDVTTFELTEPRLGPHNILGRDLL